MKCAGVIKLMKEIKVLPLKTENGSTKPQTTFTVHALDIEWYAQHSTSAHAQKQTVFVSPSSAFLRTSYTLHRLLAAAAAVRV